MSSVVVSQVICMFLLLLGTLFCGILPVYVKEKLFSCDCTGLCKKGCRARRGKLITSFLIYFGGGVLLGTCILHLLPESREGFESEHEHHEKKQLNETIFVNSTLNETIFVNGTLNKTENESDHKHHEKFPMPEFIVCCGFFAVYLFEEIVHYFLGGHSHIPPKSKAIRSFSRSSSCAGFPRRSIAGTSVSHEYKPYNPDNLTPACTSSSIDCRGSDPYDLRVSIRSIDENRRTSNHTEKFSIAGLLTVAALSFHSLFEGFAVGLQSSNTGTWVVFIAIAVHKYVIAFVVGLEVLAGGGKNLQVYIYMTVFSLMSPIGMAIAMITQGNFEDSSPVTVSVLNGIATGTLLYVTFFEILQREEHKDISTWLQLIATSVGFALMCLMQFASTFV